MICTEIVCFVIKEQFNVQLVKHFVLALWYKFLILEIMVSGCGVQLNQRFNVLICLQMESCLCGFTLNSSNNFWEILIAR